MNYYYFTRNQQTFGPFTLDQLLAEGVTPETYVFCQGMAAWTPAQDVPEVAALFAAPVAPAAPVEPASEDTLMVDSAPTAATDAAPADVASEETRMLDDTNAYGAAAAAGATAAAGAAYGAQGAAAPGYGAPSYAETGGMPPAGYGASYGAGQPVPQRSWLSEHLPLVIILLSVFLVLVIVGIVFAVKSSKPDHHVALDSEYDSPTTEVAAPTSQEPSTVDATVSQPAAEQPAAVQPAPQPSVPDGIPSSANCTVSGNIPGYGSYTLVFQGSSGQISPGNPSKAGRLAYVSYDRSSGYLSATATTPNGTEVGYYEGVLLVSGGRYVYSGTFCNTKGKCAAFTMTGR